MKMRNIKKWKVENDKNMEKTRNKFDVHMLKYSNIFCGSRGVKLLLLLILLLL